MERFVHSHHGGEIQSGGEKRDIGGRVEKGLENI